MKIAFFDSMQLDYNIDTPLTRPLGGSQSALCYLAAALSQMGHDVSLINHTVLPGRYGGVWSHGVTGEGALTDDSIQCLRGSEIVVVLSLTAGRWLRKHGQVTCPLILWAHHATNIPHIRDLQNTQERDVWSGFAFTSQWALDGYVEQFGIRPELSRVFHNGIAPVFALQEPAPPWFETPAAAPVLAYTSTPFRGLDVLLIAFSAIRAAIPETQLRVYSGMNLYGQPSLDANFQALYDHCRQTPGIAYIGPVPQSQLVHELSGIAALAYPSTYPETFCIAAAEAMSAGALLLTTKLGALPELFGEFALMIAPNEDRKKLAENYAAHVVAAINTVRRDPAGAAARRADQIDFIRTKYFWPSIAMQWAAWLRGVARSR